MSNSVVHHLLNRGFTRPVSFEHRNKLNSSCVPAVGKIGKSSLGTQLYGKGLQKTGRRLITETGRPVSFVTRAVLAMDPASQVHSFHFLWRSL